MKRIRFTLSIMVGARRGSLADLPPGSPAWADRVAVMALGCEPAPPRGTSVTMAAVLDLLRKAGRPGAAAGAFGPWLWSGPVELSRAGLAELPPGGSWREPTTEELAVVWRAIRANLKPDDGGLTMGLECAPGRTPRPPR